MRNSGDHSSESALAHPRPVADGGDARLPPVRVRYAVNVIQDARDRLLLLRRASCRSLGAGLWGLCGGHIEPGESPRACALREMREELGKRHRVRQLASLDPVRDTHYGGVMEVHLFHFRWLEGDIALDPEHGAFAWVTRSEFPTYPVMDGVEEDLAYFGIWR